MRSSADPGKYGKADGRLHKDGPVRLPSFEEMVWIEPPPAPELPPEEDEPAGEAAQEEAPEEETEAERAAALLANMRREALAEAERIVAAAMQEAVSIRDKSRRETVKALREEAEQEREITRASLLKAIQAFHDAREALYDELEPYFLEIALHISECILHYELSRDEQAYLSIVRNALSIYRADGKARAVYLPPKGYDMLVGEDENGPLMQQFMDAGIRVERDKTVAEGDCLVESPVGGIRAGVVTELSRIRYAASPEKDE